LRTSAKKLSTREIVLSNKHLDSIDIQMTPMVRLVHTGDGLFVVAPQVKVAFLDTAGKRQQRTYLYDSPLQLPMGNSPQNWASDDLRVFKRHLSVAYETLAEVILADQQGRFLQKLNSDTPDVIREEKVGFITAKTVLIAEQENYRVTHGMVGSTRGTQHIIVEDKRTAAALLNSMK
jgi:hypothetical protein